MKKEIRDIINKNNAQKSTGPTSEAGRQRASMNAFKHGLTGNRMILQTHEHEAYERLAKELTKDLAPKTEQERQLVQKLIDCHTRLNRIAALDGNILNFGLTQNESAADHDDALETIAAQCRSWIENADSFEKLGRYEARISRQMLQYTKELERLQADRAERERIAAFEAAWAEQKQAREAEEAAAAAARKAQTEDARQAAAKKPDNPESASFRHPTPKRPGPTTLAA